MYGDRENTQWFSQTLMTHKDKYYGTDGYLRVSMSTNTEDYKFFNPPMLNLSIQNNYQKSYNLNYHNSSDLLKTLQVVKSQSNGNNSEIQRKYQKNMTLYIKFFVENNNNDPVVDIRLLSNETDFTKIIIPIEIFSTFGKCLRYFVDEYFNICTQLLGQSIQSQATQIIHQLPSLIKGISSQIVQQDFIPDSRAPEVEPEKVARTQATIADLDDFLGGEEMKNIVVPELGEEKVIPLVEVKSLLVEHVLKNDLFILENMLNNHSMNPDPIRTFASELQNKLGPEIEGDFTMLPDIEEHDLKSLLYMSKMYYSTSHLNHILNDSPLPASIPIFKYNARKARPENMDIAYDLFLFSLYIRTVRNRLEGKSSDIMANKALFHIQLRCFADVFIFSFIGKDQTVNLESIISNRYSYFDSIGVFDKYKQQISEMKCPEIKQHDVISAVAEAIEKVIGKSPDVNALHLRANGNFRIPSKNNFNLEQIINEIIPLEVAEKIGKDIKKSEVLEEINKNTPISDEIVNFFNKGKTKVAVKKEGAFSNNLQRIVNFYSTEISDQYKDAFIKHVSEFSDTKYDLSTREFPLDEFGDNIIRALYLWDPAGDPKIKTSYSYFQKKIEQEIMEKDLILAKTKTEGVKESGSSDWDCLND